MSEEMRVVRIKDVKKSDSEEIFRKFFSETFGPVSEVILIRDHQNNKPKGTGTIVFEAHGDAERVLASPQHFIDGKMRRVERCVKQDQQNTDKRAPAKSVHLKPLKARFDSAMEFSETIHAMCNAERSAQERQAQSLTSFLADFVPFRSENGDYRVKFSLPTTLESGDVKLSNVKIGNGELVRFTINKEKPNEWSRIGMVTSTPDAKSDDYVATLNRTGKEEIPHAEPSAIHLEVLYNPITFKRQSEALKAFARFDHSPSVENNVLTKALIGHPIDLESLKTLGANETWNRQYRSEDTILDGYSLDSQSVWEDYRLDRGLHYTQQDRQPPIQGRILLGTSQMKCFVIEQSGAQLTQSASSPPTTPLLQQFLVCSVVAVPIHSSPHRSFSSCETTVTWIQILMNARVAITTCQSSAMKIFNQLKPSHIIIDEAAQACLPEGIIPIMNGAKKVALFGDHHQLPPLILQKMLASTSIMERMIDNGAPTIMLLTQHRMHSTIAEFPSKAIYDGQLRNQVDEEPEVECLDPYDCFELDHDFWENFFNCKHPTQLINNTWHWLIKELKDRSSEPLTLYKLNTGHSPIKGKKGLFTKSPQHSTT
ncbi:hypothetical protein WR25_15429 isoform B [Diploscapter pachys]|uniref:RRM domain-containing protein n=1 Tax=Diploscapter pachys TaxID=2018661 RepID=A0A2A2LNV1_9BILA|nr:hypothetical protein WR25_15429 isoform A [Diploscapter pachys]PAV87667.1 hypothetical protein WR25_15429 isoform B [Diploscapter pachys]